MRAYELMVIFDGDLDEEAVERALTVATDAVTSLGVTVASTDRWGKRKFAYEIDHKQDGYYVVLELVTEGQDLSGFERSLRLADEVVRHKHIRLPESEATRRGLLGGEVTPASAG